MSRRRRVPSLSMGVGLVPILAALTVALAGAAERRGDDLDSMIDGPPAPLAPDVVTRDPNGRATLRAVRIDEPISVDGRLEERVYREVPSVSGFFQQEPHEGLPATEQTEVWIFYDHSNVYLSARLWDSSPERITAKEMRRDNRGIFSNDNFAVILDTFYDRRNGFLFQTNPLGGLYDAQVTDENNTNADWNTVWNVKTAFFPEGWTVEMVIPFKSLRYRAGEGQIWGINFRRITKYKNEWSYLTPIPASFSREGLLKLSQAATLVGIETPERSMNLELKPYVKGAVLTDLEAEPMVSNDPDADVGVDLKYGVTKSLTFDLTYNTDFAQVEADEAQVNLTRFSLFFPEKREFFLEGQGIFTFGGRESRPFEGPSDAPIMFFSRRIGLADDGEVPILAGGRLTGRAGAYSIGLLSISTKEALFDTPIPATNFSVVRVKRDILRRSNIGFIGTYRSNNVDGTGTNSLFGVDANFSFFQNLNVTGYYATTDTPDLQGGDTSYRAALEYNGNKYGLKAEHLLVDPDFNPEVGFLRRDDIRKSSVGARYSPRPASIEAVRKFDFEGRYDYYETTAGDVETKTFELEFRTSFENSDFGNVTYNRNFEYLFEPFEITDGIFIPVGGYHFDRLRAGYWFSSLRPVSGWVGAEVGSFFGGNRTELSYWGRIDFTSRISLEPNLSLNWIDLPQGSFTTNVVRTRFNYTLSPRTLLSALVQYNSADEALSTNIRFRWEYEPGSDLFVVYSDGRDTLTPGFPSLESRSFVVKFTRLFRF